ncbi:hypothetical protein [Fulvivirga sedimenti]|uniref:Rieske domain-containing protein n=1 Tax=Fulvivirga sedimenti TaxID=2879465 RepID=A0A9X1KYV0_9BACT|nr:hypothetical protein [Fulvivirga sedimenti]MCA6078273.1 hypothetical protein [Fulvivirga sedimenti]
MTTRKKLRSVLSVIFLAVLAMSCERETFVDEIPPITFDDIFINLSLLEYNDLKIRGYQSIPAGGNSRGIILYRINNEYRAFERTCSYQPYEATALVDVTPAGNAMTDFSCGSIFGFDNGYPEAGPARSPLLRYRTILDNGFLTITDEVIN